MSEVTNVLSTMSDNLPHCFWNAAQPKVGLTDVYQPERPQTCNVPATCAPSAAVVSCRYAAPLYVDIRKSIITRQPDGEEEEIEEMYPKTFLGEVRPLALPRSWSWVHSGRNPVPITPVLLASIGYVVHRT